MEITIADVCAWVFREQLTIDHAEGRAWSRKVDAFGPMAKFTGLLQRARDGEFELIYKEHRYAPFWEIRCSSRYVYERKREYRVEVESPAVRRVHIDGTDYEPVDGAITVNGMEYCREEHEDTTFVDGLSNEHSPKLARYLDYDKRQVPADQLNSLGTDTVLVPPRVKASAVVRDILARLVKSLDADTVTEDRITVEAVNLYYRPVYAFEYAWKDKTAVMEYDGLTGELRADGQVFREYANKIFDPNLLIDIGADTASMIVPGGGIGIKLVKWGIGAMQAREAREARAKP
jgi:hypothetical protein